MERIRAEKDVDIYMPYMATLTLLLAGHYKIDVEIREVKQTSNLLFSISQRIIGR